MDIDLVDAEQVKSAETIKKPIKQEAVKKEVMVEKTLPIFFPRSHWYVWKS